MPAALSSHFKRNWARSTVIRCSLHWQYHAKWVPTLWVCVKCVWMVECGSLWYSQTWPLWHQPTQTSERACWELVRSSRTKWQPYLAVRYIFTEQNRNFIVNSMPLKSVKRCLMRASSILDLVVVLCAGLTCLSAGPGGDWRAPYHQRRCEGTTAWKLRVSVWVGCS